MAEISFLFAEKDLRAHLPVVGKGKIHDVDKNNSHIIINVIFALYQIDMSHIKRI